MVDIKKELSNLLNKEVNIDTYSLIKEIKEKDKGDYTFPCFALAKELHKAPNQIADDLKVSIKSDLLEKIESVNGYLNFYMNKEFLIKENEKAKKAEITNHCRQQCAACGSNSLNGGKCDALCKNMV